MKVILKEKIEDLGNGACRVKSSEFRVENNPHPTRRQGEVGWEFSPLNSHLLTWMDGWELSPDSEQSAEGCARPLRVRMGRIPATKVNDFSVAVDGSLLIFTTVVSEMPFHQPRLGVMRIDIQNTVEKYLGNFPTFFRNRSCCV